MNILTETQKAYLAGLIDGEGYISLLLYLRPYGKGRVYQQFACKFSVSNTNLSLLQTIRSWVGEGTIRLNKRPKLATEKEKGWKASYLWVIYPSVMRYLLPLILPYLIIKKEQAELVLSYLAIVRGKGYGSHSSQEEKERKMVIVNKLRILNQRGVYVSV